MKNLISTFMAVTLLATISISADETWNMPQPTVFVFGTNWVEFAATNLALHGLPYESHVNIPEMLKTNGLNCWVGASSFISTDNPKPMLGAYVYNHSTNEMACLRMPAINLLRIVLLDKQGHQFKKTSLGMKYGLPLSQEQIYEWRHHWNNRHQSIFIRLTPNGIPQYSDIPTEICNFSIKDAFEITEPGEYELHLQLRLVQVGTDKSGKFYYPVTWLPEVVAKVQIRPEDISP
jgi:hypothetical protein